MASLSAAAWVRQLPSPFRGRAATDPLGVRADFPAAVSGTYLHSAYVTPSPTPVVEASQRFLEAKSVGALTVPGMLQESDAARQLYAQLIGAHVDEIGFL